MTMVLDDPDGSVVRRPPGGREIRGSAPVSPVEVTPVTSLKVRKKAQLLHSKEFARKPCYTTLCHVSVLSSFDAHAHSW